MDSTHVAVGAGAAIGGTGIYSALATLLTGWQGMDAAHASAAATLIVYSVATISGVIAAFIRWKWPTVLPPAAPAPPQANLH